MQLDAALREHPAFSEFPIQTISLEDAFVVPKAGETIWDAAGLSAKQLTEKIRSRLSK